MNHPVCRRFFKVVFLSSSPVRVLSVIPLFYISSQYKYRETLSKFPLFATKETPGKLQIETNFNGKRGRETFNISIVDDYKWSSTLPQRFTGFKGQVFHVTTMEVRDLRKVSQLHRKM